MKCKKNGCHKKSAPSPQVYCSRDCAPYGHYSCAYSATDPVKEKRLQKRAETMKTMKEMSEAGATRTEIADALGLSPITVRTYSLKFKIPIKNRAKGRPNRTYERTKKV